MKLFKCENGFTLMEGFVAQAILFIVMIAIISVFIMGMRFNAESEDITVATNIAQQRIEEIMNTPYRYIVTQNPTGTILFTNEPSYAPYWVKDPKGNWIAALPQGKYEVSYPDGLDADPLKISVKISWLGKNNVENSLSLETLVSMTPGRFRL